MKKILIVALMITLGFAPTFSNNTFSNEGNTDTCVSKTAEEDLKCVLTGEWSFTGYAFEIIDNIHNCEGLVTANGAYLTFQFNANGTYTKSFGSDQEDKLEVGTWTISKGTHQVVLDNGSKSEFLKLGNIEDEKIELALDIEATSLEKFFCPEMNILTFNKNILPVAKPLIR